MVTPMKRITIPEIRQHQWFKVQLPRYLAVPPPDAMQHLKKVNFLFYLVEYQIYQKFYLKKAMAYVGG